MHSLGAFWVAGLTLALGAVVGFVGRTWLERPRTASDAPPDIHATIDREYQRYDLGARAWSSTYHVCVFASAVASGTAALLIKLDWLHNAPYRTDLAAALAGLAALLTTLIGIGGFDRKWRASRTGRSQLKQLKNKVWYMHLPADQAAEELNRIIQRHDEDISGAEQRTPDVDQGAGPRPPAGARDDDRTQEGP